MLKPACAYTQAGLSLRILHMLKIFNYYDYSTLDKDEGQYQCYANNGVGTAVSDIVNLRRAFIKNNSGQDPTEVKKKYRKNYTTNTNDNKKYL